MKKNLENHIGVFSEVCHYHLYKIPKKYSLIQSERVQSIIFIIGGNRIDKPKTNHGQGYLNFASR